MFLLWFTRFFCFSTQIRTRLPIWKGLWWKAMFSRFEALGICKKSEHTPRNLDSTGKWVISRPHFRLLCFFFLLQLSLFHPRSHPHPQHALPLRSRVGLPTDSHARIYLPFFSHVYMLLLCMPICCFVNALRRVLLISSYMYKYPYLIMIVPYHQKKKKQMKYRAIEC